MQGLRQNTLQYIAAAFLNYTVHFKQPIAIPLIKRLAVYWLTASSILSLNRAKPILSAESAKRG